MVDGEIYAVVPCSRREIVRAWRETGAGVTALVGALAHPGEHYVRLGDEPPDAAAREPRRPLPAAPVSGIALDPPASSVQEQEAISGAIRAAARVAPSRGTAR